MHCFSFRLFISLIEISASLSVKVFGVGAFFRRCPRLARRARALARKGARLHFAFVLGYRCRFRNHLGGEPRHSSCRLSQSCRYFQIEIDKIENWRALLPLGTTCSCRCGKFPPRKRRWCCIRLGTLRISQRALPLEIKLDKVGGQKPSGRQSSISGGRKGGGLAKKNDAFEPFAPAQFQNFSDADKLSKPAFAPEHSGLDLSAAGVEMRSSVMVKRIVRYEEIIIDSNFKRFQRRFRNYFGVLFNFFLNGAAVTRSNLSQAVQTKYKPFEEKILGQSRDVHRCFPIEQ